MDIELGKFIEGPCERDAIHVAVAPLEAMEDIYRGDLIKLAFGSTTMALSAEYDKEIAIGVADPFLPTWQIPKGSRFWCLLFPGSVSGMRHQWNHPGFPDTPPVVGDHELWLRHFCDRWNFDFEQLIEAGISADEFNGARARGKEFCQSDLGEDEALFWAHLEGYTGKKFSDKHKKTMRWSCGC